MDQVAKQNLLAKMPSAAMEDLVAATMKLVIIDFALITQNAVSQTILISISLEQMPITLMYFDTPCVHWLGHYMLFDPNLRKIYINSTFSNLHCQMTVNFINYVCT